MATYPAQGERQVHLGCALLLLAVAVTLSPYAAGAVALAGLGGVLVWLWHHPRVLFATAIGLTALVGLLTIGWVVSLDSSEFALLLTVVHL